MHNSASKAGWSGSLSFLITATIFYGFFLVYFDRRMTGVPFFQIAAALPVLLGANLLSMLIRTMRWHWFINLPKQQVTVLPSALSYVSGLAFTATPGKVGELVRMRYLARYKVPGTHVLSAFLLERTLDLVVISIIAVTAALSGGTSLLGFLFTPLVVVGFVMAPRAILPLRSLQTWLLRRRLTRACLALRMVDRALNALRSRLTLLPCLGGFLIGIAAWGVSCLGCAFAMRTLSVDVSLWSLASITAAAMLFGAVSFLPGGIGATEVALVALLTRESVPLELAVIAAMTVRLGSIWFSIMLGFVAMGLLERRLFATEFHDMHREAT